MPREGLERAWTVLCSDVIQEASGALTLLRLVDLVQVPEDPPIAPDLNRVILPVALFVATQWRRWSGLDSMSRTRQQIVVEQPDGARLPLGEPMAIDFAPEQSLLTTLVKLTELPLRGRGQYQIVVQRQHPDGDWRDERPGLGLWIPPVGWKPRHA